MTVKRLMEADIFVSMRSVGTIHCEYSLIIFRVSRLDKYANANARENCVALGNVTRKEGLLDFHPRYCFSLFIPQQLNQEFYQKKIAKRRFN